MPYCPSCGQQILAEDIHAGHKFCGTCGANVAGLAPHSQAKPASGESAQPQAGETSEKRSGFFGGFGKALLFIVGLAVLGYISDEIRRSRNNAIFKKQMERIRTGSPWSAGTRPRKIHPQNRTRQRFDATEAARGDR